VKIPKSKVGNGPFPTKIKGENIEKFARSTGECGKTTGRLRDL